MLSLDGSRTQPGERKRKGNTVLLQKLKLPNIWTAIASSLLAYYEVDFGEEHAGHGAFLMKTLLQQPYKLQRENEGLPCFTAHSSSLLTGMSSPYCSFRHIRVNTKWWSVSWLAGHAFCVNSPGDPVPDLVLVKVELRQANFHRHSLSGLLF